MKNKEKEFLKKHSIENFKNGCTVINFENTYHDCELFENESMVVQLRGKLENTNGSVNKFKEVIYLGILGKVMPD